uniref:Uncharacterized protein n=1 Tax=Glossina palpalis gambiensis TaxID=67801 RepID=A0A1B0BLL9_9MUSC
MNLRRGRLQESGRYFVYIGLLKGPQYTENGLRIKGINSSTNIVAMLLLSNSNYIAKLAKENHSFLYLYYYYESNYLMLIIVYIAVRCCYETRAFLFNL